MKFHYPIILTICLVMLSFFMGRAKSIPDSVSMRQHTDTIFIQSTDTVYIPNEIMITPYFDSLSTRRIMEEALFLNHINFEKCTRNDLIYQRHDMEYLPYYFLTFSSSTIPSLMVEHRIYDCHLYTTPSPRDISG